MTTLELDVGDLRPIAVTFTAEELVVTLADGRKIATPLSWYPRLKDACRSAREHLSWTKTWALPDAQGSAGHLTRGSRRQLIRPTGGRVAPIRRAPRPGRWRKSPVRKSINS
jgi:hypothetical protein